MTTTLCQLLGNSTQFLSTVPEACIVALHWNKITRNEQCIATFQDMWQQHYININKNQNIVHNIHRINGSDPDMGKENKQHTKRTHHSCYQSKRKPASNNCGNINILWQGSGPCKYVSFGINYCKPSQEKWNKIPSRQSTVRLMCHKFRFHNKIQEKKRGAPRPYW